MTQLPDEYKVWQSSDQITAGDKLSDKSLARYVKDGKITKPIMHNKTNYYNTREVFAAMSGNKGTTKRTKYLTWVNQNKNAWMDQGFDDPPMPDKDDDNASIISSNSYEESIYYFNGDNNDSMLKFFTKHAGKLFKDIIIYPNTISLKHVIETTINKIEDDIIVSLYVENDSKVDDYTFRYYLKKKEIAIGNIDL